MNSNIQRLHSYPFVKLRSLLLDLEHKNNLASISFAIGEPQSQPPESAKQALVSRLGKLNAYPSALGELELRESIAKWLAQRYSIALDKLNPEHNILPLQGTREGLFAIAQVLVNSEEGQNEKPLVLMPSPFYQIYEGATILAGAEPLYLPCEADHNFQIDFDRVTELQWQRCQLIYVCNPSNPTGALISATDYKKLLALSDKFNFFIVSDECYSEIYSDENQPCKGLLEVCYNLGREDFSRCLVFNSLSKRSNLAGLRSGFVAGDKHLIKAFLKYRTYHGSAMPFHHQAASIAAWNDESHVISNRADYREKLFRVAERLSTVLEVDVPPGGFCLWLKVPIDDQLFAANLFVEEHVTVLPGSYLARDVNGYNPGKNYIRIALVQSLVQCLEAADRMVRFIKNLE